MRDRGATLTGMTPGVRDDGECGHFRKICAIVPLRSHRLRLRPACARNILGPMTTRAVSLRCSCGAIQGVADVDPSQGTRLVCYCDDCQAYAHFLGRNDVLDERGGTDIFQIWPARVRITQGADQLRCMRLTAKGLHRWYAGCCRTPIGNTVGSARLPFVGLVHSFMAHDVDGQTRDEAVGPLRGGSQARFAIGGVPPNAHPTAPLGLILHAMSVMLRGVLARAHRPSPFFDSVTKRPVVEPMVLAADEHERLRKLVAEGARP